MAGRQPDFYRLAVYKTREMTQEKIRIHRLYFEEMDKFNFHLGTENFIRGFSEEIFIFCLYLYSR